MKNPQVTDPKILCLFRWASRRKDGSDHLCSRNPHPKKRKTSWHQCDCGARTTGRGRKSKKKPRLIVWDV